MPLPSAVAPVLGRLASPPSGRTEADVQADVRELLLNGELNLGDAQVRLETPAENRRRIDVEVGLTVIEIKKNLGAGQVLAQGEEQLASYVAARQEQLAQRYVGILTDGRTWRLYNVVGDEPRFVHEHRLDAARGEDLLDWLDGILATQVGIIPTPDAIEDRLGAASSAYALERATLLDLWRTYGAASAECRLKRELWARLLTTALGTKFEDQDDLFVEHTYLVLTAEILAHAVVGLDITDPGRTPESLVRGTAFHAAQLHNVVEEDFFDWAVDVPGGRAFVRTLARRLARFDWSNVEHDILKILYESVINAEQRKKLGEYYTPDWLAERMVSEVYTDPLSTRAMDPSCGSGTFVFHMVRAFLSAADETGLTGTDALPRLVNSVFGMDVHPVAVTLARVTYLMAIGTTRLQAADRPALTIPVYLGDSLRWQDSTDVFGGDGVTVHPTEPGGMLPGFEETLFFPADTMKSVVLFDQLVAEMSSRASNRERHSAIPSMSATYTRLGVLTADVPALDATFSAMCRLHDRENDHIWGYYVRNTTRPYWLSQVANKVDLLIGNVPWLAYRFMPLGMQRLFKERSVERHLWAGRQLVTHQDLSAYFVVRSVELYLISGGTFFFLMPHGVLDRGQFSGFRRGTYDAPDVHTRVAFDQPWDLSRVRPPIFPMPAAAIRGTLLASEESV